MLLPHNNEVTKPRALNTFLDRLAELGIDKGLIKNKKLLSDLIEKEGYQNVENTSENESNNEESSSYTVNQEKEEEVASENGVEAKGIQERERERVFSSTLCMCFVYIYIRVLALNKKT